MQIGSIGSEHDTHLHNVSNCVHESPDTDKKAGGMMNTNMQKSMDSLQISYTDYPDTQELVSASNWFERLSGGIKKLFMSFWERESVQNENATESVAKEVVNAEAASVVACSDEKVQQAAAVNGSPYFKPVENTRRADNLTRIVKNKIHEVTGFLARHFSFSGRNGFDTGRKDAKADLRRRSRYRENDMEMDCMLTDDSYLMDSYDRRGAYSTLSTKQ